MRGPGVARLKSLSHVEKDEIPVQVNRNPHLNNQLAVVAQVRIQTWVLDLFSRDWPMKTEA